MLDRNGGRETFRMSRCVGEYGASSGAKTAQITIKAKMIVVSQGTSISRMEFFDESGTLRLVSKAAPWIEGGVKQVDEQRDADEEDSV